jgi:hypothetical protein
MHSKSEQLTRWRVSGAAGLVAVVIGAFMLSRGFGVIMVGLLVFVISALRHQSESRQQRKHFDD